MPCEDATESISEANQAGRWASEILLFLSMWLSLVICSSAIVPLDTCSNSLSSYAEALKTAGRFMSDSARVAGKRKIFFLPAIIMKRSCKRKSGGVRG